MDMEVLWTSLILLRIYTQNGILKRVIYFMQCKVQDTNSSCPFKTRFSVYFQNFWREVVLKVWVVIYHWNPHEQLDKKWFQTHPKITESSQLSYQNAHHMQFSNQTLRILLLWISFAKLKLYIKWKLRRWRIHRYSQF